MKFNKITRIVYLKTKIKYSRNDWGNGRWYFTDVSMDIIGLNRFNMDAYRTLRCLQEGRTCLNANSMQCIDTTFPIPERIDGYTIYAMEITYLEIADET